VDSIDITAKYHEPALLFLNQRDGTFKNISKLVGPASRLCRLAGAWRSVIYSMMAGLMSLSKI